MPTIDIIIRNKTASAVNPPCIVCGNSDYNVKFDFDDEWQAHNNKIGVFAYNRCGEWRSENVLFEGDTCPVPALHGVRSVWIGVTAGDVRTSTPADVPCRMGATDFSDTDEPPSADVWGQILAKLDELQTEIDEIKAGGVGGTDISLGVTGATVGQTVNVKAVDANGKPTAWEAVDMAAGDTEVWEKVCQVTTTENVSFIYQPFGGNYKKIRAIFLGESTAACQVWIYPNTETRPLSADRAYIFNAPYAAAGTYRIVGEFSSSPYPAPNSSDNWYRGRCSIDRGGDSHCLHAGWGDNLFDNYVDDSYASLGEGSLAQGIKSLYWMHNTGEIKAGAQMVVYGVKA